MNKSKIVFIGTFIVMVAFILTLSFFYTKATKKKVHFLFQLGEHIPGTQDDIEPEHAAVDIKFSRDDSRIITLLNNGDIEIWDLDKQARITDYKTSGNLSFCNLNDYIIIMENGGVFSVDINSNDRFKITSGAYKFSSLDNSCEILALSDGSNNIELWNLAEQRLVNKIKSELPVRNGLTISPDGTLLAAAEGIYHGSDHNHETIIETWKINRNEMELILKIDRRTNGTVLGIWNLLFSPDNSKIIYDTQKSAHSGIAITGLGGNAMFEKDDLDSYWTRALAVSPDGKTLASGDENGNLALWDIDTQEIKSYYRMGYVIESLEFSASGTMLAAGLSDSTIQMFQIIKSQN